MRVLIASAMAIFLIATPSLADEEAVPKLSCASFRERLNATIHADGDQVATPKDYTVLRKGDIPRILYGLSGIVGVQGDLNCAMNDDFRQFSFKAKTVASTDAGTAMILNRLVALMSGSLCAANLAKGANCHEKALDLTARAVHDLKVAHDRGEPFAHGEQQLSMPDVATAHLMVLPDELLFEVVNDQ